MTDLFGAFFAVMVEEFKSWSMLVSTDEPGVAACVGAVMPAAVSVIAVRIAALPVSHASLLIMTVRARLGRALCRWRGESHFVEMSHSNGSCSAGHIGFVCQMGWGWG